MSTNKHFNNSERPAYELPYLIANLGLTSSTAKLSADQIQMVAAAKAHAINANDTIMTGIESLGHLLYIAGGSDDDTDSQHFRNLGQLIKHLAVEAQHLQQVDADMGSLLRKAKVAK
jgi:hypothetical protein